MSEKRLLIPLSMFYVGWQSWLKKQNTMAYKAKSLADLPLTLVFLPDGWKKSKNNRSIEESNNQQGIRIDTQKSISLHCNDGFPDGQSRQNGFGNATVLLQNVWGEFSESCRNVSCFNGRSISVGCSPCEVVREQPNACIGNQSALYRLENPKVIRSSCTESSMYPMCRPVQSAPCQPSTICTQQPVSTLPPTNCIPTHVQPHSIQSRCW